MTEDRFWELIGKVFQMPTEEIQKHGYDQLQNGTITDEFKDKGIEAIPAFHEILCKKIQALYLPKIGELFLLTAYDLSAPINQEFKYISTDGFVDFRAWIVSLGKEAYETYLNFQFENEVFQFDMDANSAYREDLVYLADRAAEEIFGKEIDLDYYTDKDMEELYAKMNWSSLEGKYPNLFKFYQDRFRNGYYE